VAFNFQSSTFSWRALGARLAALFRKRRLEAEMSEEFRLHLEQRTRENVAGGMSPENARFAALKTFGGTDQFKEIARDGRGFVWLEQIGQDLRYAFRQICKAPGFAVVAIVTLGLGIGAASAIFSVVNSVLFKPLPYADSDRLVWVRETRLPKFPTIPIAPATFRDWARETTDIFETIYAETGGSFNLTGSGEPVRVLANRVDYRFFVALRAPVLLGRVFGADENQPGRDDVAVLNHGFWLRQFGGRPEIVGESIQLNGRPFTVIGVLAPEFQRGSSRDILVPLALSDKEWASRKSHMLSSLARLKPGVTIEQARARMSVIAAQHAQQYPDTDKDVGADVVSLLDGRTEGSRGLLFTLAGAVALLLLIACTNVANLLLARATTREREISVRIALGAGRGRIARQLITESLVLALAGALLGLAVGEGGLAAMLAYAPPVLPRGNFEILLDGRAALVTVGLSILTGLGFGLVPAIQGSRVDLSGAMKQGGRGTAGSHRNLTRNVLVVVEIALALVLLTGAGLLIRSFAQVARFDPGFNPHGTVIMSVMTTAEKYNTPAKQIAFADAVVERLRSVPGVTSASATQVLPFSGRDFVVTADIDGRPATSGPPPSLNHFMVSKDFFTTMGIRLMRGRLFDERDRLGATPVAIVSEEAAAVLFPGEDPLGRRIATNNEPKTWREIVGVVSNVTYYNDSTEQQTWPQSYVPLAQSPFPVINFLVHADGAMPSGAILRHEVYAVDAEQPIARLYPFDELLMQVFARQRFAMMILGTFSVLALLLAMIGIYGVMAFSVSRRSAEFGVRMALGAKPADVMRLILRQAGRLVGGGIALGLIGALATGQFIQSMLYRTPANDPLVLGAIALLLFAVALLASFLPARRATKVDPVIALRAD
jgi:predicted permease